MDEVLFYKILDIICTVNESVIFLLFMAAMTDKDIRSKRNIWIMVWFVIATVIATYTIPSVTLKSLLLSVTCGIGWSLIKGYHIIEGLTIAILEFGWVGNVQAVCNYLMSFWNQNPSFDMGKFYMVSWQYNVFMQIVCLGLTILLYRVLKNHNFRWKTGDLILVGVISWTELVINASGMKYLMENGSREALRFSMGLFWVTFFLIIHFQQTSNLRVKEEKENQRLQKLELELSHYHAKAEEEQKVRKIYHDMKNLMLAAKLNGEETSLLNTVEQELKEYGQYYETGNVFLNVILKEKLKLAEEKEIDMQLDVDFSAGDFIADRDIVIIYGNALDNAIEACEKLPASERLVTVKTQQIRNMLSIFIENNMLAEDNPNLHTTKKDVFLHGFGLTNIKEAVERYDGTYTIETGKGVFILQILIPIP